MFARLRQRRFGIRGKLLATVTLPMAALILAAAGTLALVELRHARADAEDAAQAIARAVNQDLERLYLTQEQARGADLVDRLASFRDVLRVVAFDDQRRPFFNYLGRGVPPAAPQALSLSGGEAAVRHGSGSIALTAPLTSAARPIGTVLVELSTEAAGGRLTRTFTTLIGAASLALLSSVVVGSFIERTVSRPIVELAAAMDHVTQDQRFDLRAAVTSQDEVGKLAGAFNTMLDRIRASDEALRAANRHLETKVAERTAELSASVASLEREVAEHARTQAERERLYRELVDASRQAGMAEVATGVLHNVGNVLNSLNVSAGLLVQRCERSRVGGVEKLSRMLAEGDGESGSLPAGDGRSRKVVDYVRALAATLQDERSAMLEELKRLTECVAHVKQVVATQQDYSRHCTLREPTVLAEVVEDALKINAMGMERHQVTVERQFGEVPSVTTERHRVLQILVNLLSNAKYATSAVTARPRLVRLRIRERDDQALVEVIDNGVGIAADAMTRIFSHGFTTRPDGHGFGLHISALAARELGGSLQAASEGPGRGATFTLALPLDAPPAGRAAGAVVLAPPPAAALAVQRIAAQVESPPSPVG